MGQGIKSIFIVYILTFGHAFDVAPLILRAGHEGLAGEGSYLDMLDRELGEISREIGEDQASMTAHIFQDAYSKVQLESKFTKIPYNMRSQRSLEQLPQDEASTPSVTTIHHVRDPPHAETAASDLVK